MRKKIVCVLLIGMVGLFSACGQNNSTGKLQETENHELQKENEDREPEKDFKEVTVYEKEQLSYEDTVLTTQVDYIFTTENQNLLQNEIDGMLEANTYSFEQPLALYNPYGTNFSAVNFYFTTEEAVEISYVIHVEGFEDYAATLYNGSEDNFTREHAYQVTGFLPGYVNQVTFSARNKEQILYEKTFIIELPAEESLQFQITKEEGDSTESLSEGLFLVAAKGTNYNGSANLYDNNGILRSTLAVDDYRSDNILFTEDSIIYPITSTALGEFNRLGRMINRYELGEYQMHHDIAWLKEGESILALATDVNIGSLEDQLIQVELESGEVSLLVDFRSILPETYQMAIENRNNAKNYLGNENLDWIHLNSIAVIDHDSVLVSARELSAVIKVDHITTEPALGYLIGSEIVFEETAEENALLMENGESTVLGGQHSLVYTSIDENSYYLELYNNNYFSMESRTDITAEKFPDAGSINEGTSSYYAKYLVDEQEGTYELIQAIPVEYSAIMSSVQPYDSHIIISSAYIGVYYEYDSQGALVARFAFDNDSFCYRTFKVSMNHFWYVE